MATRYKVTKEQVEKLVENFVMEAASPEAKKHIQGNVTDEKVGHSPKTSDGRGSRKQAPEAKKHIMNMNEGVTLGGIKFEPINEGMYEEGQSRSSAMKLDGMIRDMENKPFLGGYLLDYKNTGKQLILWVSTEPAQPGQKISDIPKLGYVSIWAGNENWDFDGIDSRKVLSKDLEFLATIKSLAFSMEEGLYEEEMGGEENVGELVADKIQDVLSADEVNVLVQAYQKGGKEMIANALSQSVNEGDYDMNQGELKLRQILDKLIKRGALGSLAGILPAAMMGHPALAVGLGIAALAGTALKDAAWWKKNGHHYGAQDKYGVKEGMYEYGSVTENARRNKRK